ncbi:hypothetical protein AKJ58_01230 [candidate division MSBL1 archaeon SCGC-AAA385D11]|uniref:Uncharacterized protein n=1 Tax=candidate division MSBL1 archaeon SCGC-AAA385D11 TaxID=1698286 RepID=A0A133VNJ0_9EURY|nr:hypothetical protein AKJ58_01230 [candidate division MSBL1 archaeon SCGC-AAA385D11]
MRIDQIQKDKIKHTLKNAGEMLGFSVITDRDFWTDGKVEIEWAGKLCSMRGIRYGFKTVDLDEPSEKMEKTVKGCQEMNYAGLILIAKEENLKEVKKLYDSSLVVSYMSMEEVSKVMDLLVDLETIFHKKLITRSDGRSPKEAQKELGQMIKK